MNTEEYWRLWEESLSRTLDLNLNPSFGPEFEFKDVSLKKIQGTISVIEGIFTKIIKKRDRDGISREITRLDCTRLSYELQGELKKNGIKSILVTGDYVFHGEPMYNVSEKYIVSQLGASTPGMGLHTWLVLDNYLLVDPSIIIFNEKEKFLAKEIDGKPCITDIEKINSDLFYIPFVLGEEYLIKINALHSLSDVLLSDVNVKGDLYANVSFEPSRNTLCPCDSGNKYKYCCGKLT
ncbi:SEC-C domain-containing protein [Vibrio diabolicus]